MQFNKSALAALLTCATLAFGGCTTETSSDKPSSHENSKVGSVGMALTLPDDSEITTVSYTITGPNNYSRTGSVPVGNSTVLTFRIGGIPVGNGYTIALSAQTSFGNSCAGTATFNILDSNTTRVSVLLLCGATDNDGDIIVDGEFESCPVITSISAIPGETRAGGTIALSSTISHGSTPVVWTGSGGTFADAGDYDTTFTCGAVSGTYTLTVTIDSTEAACDASSTVDVICSPAAGCGNGVVDLGEQCDDGNSVNTDACTNACLNASCGDGITGPGEECDDGNGTNDDDCSNACDLNDCGDGEVDPGEVCDGTPNCNPATCTPFGCGDGIVTAPEQCDDGNSVDNDACTNACTTPRCGDSIVQAPEACDDGNSVAGDGCENDCTATPSAGGDQANQLAACRQCRSDNCTAFQGVFDLVAACFQNADPAFVQQCIDVKNCAYQNDCGYSATGAPECFCGTVDLNTCQTPGQANGPCQAQFFAAARTTQLGELIGRFGDVSLPVGVANYFIQCDFESCPACQP